MLDAAELFQKMPRLRPTMNVGCLFDVPAGTYYKGKHGESILSGGFPHVVGLCGRGNTFKSTLEHFFHLSVLNRYASVDRNLVYDTENSSTPARFDSLAAAFPNLQGRDLDDEGKILITDGAMMMGNKWWDSVKKYAAMKEKEQKKLMLTTPFIDKSGKNLKIIQPTMVEIDSMSEMKFDSVALMLDKAEVGDSGRNMEAMKSSAAKSSMIGEMANLSNKAGMYLSMTAHLDDEIQMDPYAPPTKRLADMQQKTIFKRVPKNFSFLTNVLYACSKTTVLWNKSDKTPLYPGSDAEKKAVGSKDLRMITVDCYRNKGGQSGAVFELIVSQTEGILAGLSEFWYCKSRKFGFEGNDQRYNLEIYPEVTMQRTTVRSQIKSDPKLKRALEITSELCQMKHLWTGNDDIMCTPKELYENLKAKGFDWDVLLGDTRGYWIFEEDEKNEPLKFLSTMDLLLMRSGEYPKPYWYDKHMAMKQKEQEKANATKAQSDGDLKAA